MRGKNYYPIQTFNQNNRLNSLANRDQLQRKSLPRQKPADMSGTGAFLCILVHSQARRWIQIAGRMGLQAAVSISQISPIMKLLFNYDNKQVPP